MVSLLDVNVLIALFDPAHVHHEDAHDWFGEQRAHGWATCAITENGVVRILSSPTYPGRRTTMEDAVDRLARFCESGHHEFWEDALSLRAPGRFRVNHVLGHRQLTDVYLLGLAVLHNAALATFDGSIPVKAVNGARGKNLALIRS